MKKISSQSVSRGVALLALALLPAYCSIEGFVTGETIAIDKRTNSYTDAAGVVTAIAYGMLAAALLFAAASYFTANSKRQALLAEWGWGVMIVGAVLFFAGRIVSVVQ